MFLKKLPLNQLTQADAFAKDSVKSAARVASLAAGILLSAALCWAQKDASQDDMAPPALASTVVHRIQVEVRSRYSIPPPVEVAVSAPTRSQFPGYDQVTITFKGDGHSSTHDFLLSRDRKTLANLEKIDISQDLMSKINLAGRPIRGTADAKVTVVIYDDFQCPFCGRMYGTLFPDVFKQYKDRVKIIFKDYPLIEIHPWAMHAAVDGNCLAEQNTEAYWDYSDYVHANQKAISGNSHDEAFTNLDAAANDQGNKHHLNTEQLQACVKKQDDSSVRAEMAEADKIGVDSTPTLFIDGDKIAGAVGADSLHAALDSALAYASANDPQTQAIRGANQNDSNKKDTTAK